MDIVIEDARWADVPLEDIATRAAGMTLAHVGLPADAEVALLACNDARIKELNAEFREKDRATNVLSWPAQELAADDAGATPSPPTPDFDGALELGDIAISYETCQGEADAAGKTMQDHVTHLIIHGILHLLGYDHIRDPDATLMETCETEILGKMGIDDPYYLASAV